MSAYLVVFLDAVTDPAELDEYRKIGGPTLAAAGAKFVVRGGGNIQTLEGDAPKQVMVVEFKDMAAARAWHDSPTYQQALQHRRKGAKVRAVFVEGVS